MLIAVCVKLIPSPRLEMELDPRTHELHNLRRLPFVVNPADLAALELGVRVKEQVGGQVVILTLGAFVSAEASGPADIDLAGKGLRPKAARLEAPDPLRRCLATGADRIIAIGLNRGSVPSAHDPTGFTEVMSGGFRPLNLDSMLVATVLAQSIRRLKAELVFCGDHSYDRGNGLVGPAMAELLDLPLVSTALNMTLEPGEKTMLVRRWLPKGERELVRCPLPCLVTASAGRVAPRYFTMPALIQAFNTGIEALDMAALGLSIKEISRTRSTRLTGLLPPRPRTKRTFIPDSSLPPEERARLAMSGGMSQSDKKGQLIEGDPQRVAAQMIQFLKNQGIMHSNEDSKH